MVEYIISSCGLLTTCYNSVIAGMMISYLKHIVDHSLYVTRFSSISYRSNSEYWTQKGAQSGNIRSIILDVHVSWQSNQNFRFNFL